MVLGRALGRWCRLGGVAGGRARASARPWPEGVLCARARAWPMAAGGSPWMTSWSQQHPWTWLPYPAPSSGSKSSPSPSASVGEEGRLAQVSHVTDKDGLMPPCVSAGKRVLRVAVCGPDRPGVATAVASLMHESGGNICEMSLDRLGGGFACVCVLSAWGEAAEDPSRMKHAIEAYDVKSEGTLQGSTIVTEWTLLDVAMPECYRIAFCFPDSGGGALARVLATLRDAGVRIPSVRSRCVNPGRTAPDATYFVDAVMGLPRGTFTPHATIFRILGDVGAQVLALERENACRMEAAPRHLASY